MYSVEDRKAGGAAPELPAGEHAVFSAWLSGKISWKISAASSVWLNLLFYQEPVSLSSFPSSSDEPRSIKAKGWKNRIMARNSVSRWLYTQYKRKHFPHCLLPCLYFVMLGVTHTRPTRGGPLDYSNLGGLEQQSLHQRRLCVSCSSSSAKQGLGCSSRANLCICQPSRLRSFPNYPMYGHWRRLWSLNASRSVLA